MQTDDDFKRLIRKVSENCKICCKASQRPDVCLPMAKSFQECIAMGIEFYKGTVMLHLVSHARRLLGWSCCIKSEKLPEKLT